MKKMILIVLTIASFSTKTLAQTTPFLLQKQLDSLHPTHKVLISAANEYRYPVSLNTSFGNSDLILDGHFLNDAKSLKIKTEVREISADGQGGHWFQVRVSMSGNLDTQIAWEPQNRNKTNSPNNPEKFKNSFKIQTTVLDYNSTLQVRIHPTEEVVVSVFDKLPQITFKKVSDNHFFSEFLPRRIYVGTDNAIRDSLNKSPLKYLIQKHLQDELSRLVQQEIRSEVVKTAAL